MWSFFAFFGRKCVFPAFFAEALVACCSHHPFQGVHDFDAVVAVSSETFGIGIPKVCGFAEFWDWNPFFAARREVVEEEGYSAISQSPMVLVLLSKLTPTRVVGIVLRAKREE